MEISKVVAYVAGGVAGGLGGLYVLGKLDKHGAKYFGMRKWTDDDPAPAWLLPLLVLAGGFVGAQVARRLLVPDENPSPAVAHPTPPAQLPQTTRPQASVPVQDFAQPAEDDLDQVEDIPFG